MVCARENETTNIFATWRKEDYSKKHITQLKTPDNQTITDPVTILNKEKYFYEHLYKSENPDIENAKFDQFLKIKSYQSWMIS